MPAFGFLRPRLTVRYVLSSVIVLYVFFCYLLGSPMLSSPLPDYSGPYEVGVIDIEVPCESRRFSDAVLKETGEPAFKLDTVLFSLYYPAVVDSVSTKRRHPWVPKPLSLQAEGYARVAGVNNYVTNNIFNLGLWALVGSTEIPAKVDVPLLGSVPQRYRDYEAQHPLDDYGQYKLPVIVFSHGTASSRTDYTQYCGELAARGYIVAIVEHRDGSGPGSYIMSQNGDLTARFPISEDGLEPKPDEAAFKIMQLAMREAEMEEAVRVLRAINDGQGRQVFKDNTRVEGEELESWRGRLDMDRVIVAGHSYGATLALQCLKGGPTPARPFAGAILLDPGKASGPLNDDIHVPIVVIHSNSWSAKHTIFHGRPHFDTVKDLVIKAAEKSHKFAWFLTSIGTTHPSVTDAPLIEPFLLSWTTGATIDVKEGIMQYVKVTDQFMYYMETGHRRGILKEAPTHPEWDNDVRDEERKARMNVGDLQFWQIHVSPDYRCAVDDGCGIDKD